MHRIIDGGRRAGASCGRFGVPVFVLLALALALPALASAAPQTLTVKKAGSGTGTVTSSPAGISCGETCAAPFAEGATVVLTGAPGTNTAAVAWSGCAKLTLENECFVTMSSAKTVTATFDLVKRKLTLEKKGTGTGTVTSSPAGINCGATCAASFTIGAAITLTATPGPKTLEPVWAGCDSIDAENKCLVTMSAARTVTVTLDASEYELTVNKTGTGGGKVTSSPAGINCGSTCSASFGAGSLVTLTGVSVAGSQPVAWSGCGSVDAENRCLVTMSAAKAVTATFNLTSYQLTVAKVGSGTGTVTGSPAGISCGPTCAASFTHKTKVTLTATSGIHTRPVKWWGCNEVTTDKKCLVTMDSAKEVVASFALELQYVEHPVAVLGKGTGKGTVTSVPGGIECGEDCTEKYLHGTALKLVATPAPGSVFDHWVGGGCTAVTGPCETTVTSQRVIRAFFVAVGKRTLTVAKAGSGAGTVSSKPAGIECGQACSAEFDASVKFNLATKVVLKAVADKGSKFSGWSGACSGTATACRVFMNEARNVTATFEAPATPPSEVFVSSTGKVRGGKALLRIACNGPSPCQGTLRLLLKVKNALGQTRGLVVGSASFSLGAGTLRTLAVKLSPRAMRLLASTGRLKLRVVGASESHGLRLAQRPL